MTRIETPNDELILQYLLNELPDDQSQALEEKFFEDDELFTLMVTIEADLVDDYARDKLSKAERLRFEKGFLLSKEKRQMTANALALGQFTERKSRAVSKEVLHETTPSLWQSILNFFSPQSPAFQYAMALLFAVMAIGAAWFAYDSIRMRQQLAANREQQAMRVEELQEQIRRVQREREELQGRLSGQNEELSSQLQSTTERLEQLERELAEIRQSQPTIVAAVLTPGISRGGDEPPNIIVRASTQLLRFQLPLPEAISDSESYSVTLNDGTGARVLHLTGVRATKTRAGLALVVRLSSKLLKENTYVLLVRGEGVGEPQPAEPYQFSVVRQ